MHISNKKDCKQKVGAITLIALISVFVFYLMLNYCNDTMCSDFAAHIRHSLRGEGYSLLNVLVILSYKFPNSNVLFAATMTFVVVGTSFACMYLIKKIGIICGTDINDNKALEVSLMSLFLCKLCIPDWSVYYYKEALATQPWHNPTYLVMRPLALITIALYFEIQKGYLAHFDVKKGILFCVALFFTNFSKPNFVIAFAPVMLVALIIDFVKTKTKSFKNAFMFGVCVLIACTILIFQTKALYPSDGTADSAIIFSFDHAIEYIVSKPKLPLYIVLNFAFPFYVTYLSIKNRKQLDTYDKKILIQTWSMYIISFMEMLFITETGHRANDGNLGWGGLFFAYLVFVVCVPALEKMKKRNLISEKEYTIARYTYCLHALFGLFYFGLLLMGYYYLF